MLFCCDVMLLLPLGLKTGNNNLHDSRRSLLVECSLFFVRLWWRLFVCLQVFCLNRYFGLFRAPQHAAKSRHIRRRRPNSSHLHLILKIPRLCLNLHGLHKEVYGSYIVKCSIAFTKLKRVAGLKYNSKVMGHKTPKLAGRWKNTVNLRVTEGFRW